MKKKLLLIISLSFISMTSFSAITSIPKSDQVLQKPLQGTQVLGFEDYREACLNPSRFHNQIAPTNIQISCHGVQLKWIPDDSTTMSMDNPRQMTASIYSDKYATSSLSGAILSPEQLLACPRFKQVTETVESLHAITCDELVAFSGTVLDFCTSRINSLRGVNPEAVRTLATGRVFDVCGNSASAGQR